MGTYIKISGHNIIKISGHKYGFSMGWKIERYLLRDNFVPVQPKGIK